MSIELGLDRLTQLIHHLPSYTRPTIHIAGTNGKGSVAAFVHSILSNTQPPFRVGRFNSPHLVSVEDCIVVGDQAISKETYSITRTRVEAADKENNTRLSSFELLTLTALLIFEEANLDVVIVEVGMGGRLDATNIIPTSCILVSALTAVDLDHQAFLGNTVEAIAKEKAGIAREGRPFVLGSQKYPSVVEIVRKEVEMVGANLVEASTVTVCPSQGSPLRTSPTAPKFNPPTPRQVAFNIASLPNPLRAFLPLPGDHQIENLGAAVAIISSLTCHPSQVQGVMSDRLTAESISRGIAATQWPGRLSFHTVAPNSRIPDLTLNRSLLLLADGAHNAASAETLSSYITDFISERITTNDESPSPVSITFIIGLSHSPPKTPQQTLSPLLPPKIKPSANICVNLGVACVPFSPVEGMPWVRPVPPDEIARVVKDLAQNADVAAFEVESQPIAGSPTNSALIKALNWAGDRKAVEDRTPELVVLAGSLYLVADLYRLIDTM